MFAIGALLASLILSQCDSAAAALVPPSNPPRSAKTGRGLDSFSQLAALGHLTNGDILLAGTSSPCRSTSTADSCDVDRVVVGRLKRDGTLDRGFGESGIASATVRGADAQVTAVDVLPSGDVVVGGSARPSGDQEHAAALLVAFTSHGQLNPSFGTGGIVTIAPPGSIYTEAESLVNALGGGLLVAGRTAQSGGPGGVLVFRTRPSGELDPAFGSGGLVVNSLPPGYGSEANEISVEDTGHVTVAGSVRSGREESAIAVLRYLADGAPDPGFGHEGVSYLGQVQGDNTAARALGMGWLPDGDLALAGLVESGFHPNPRVVLARLGPDGVPDDPSFGREGANSSCLRAGFLECSRPLAAALTPGGATLIAAGGSLSPRPTLVLARYSRSGQRDPDFGGGRPVTEAGRRGRLAGGMSLLATGEGALLGTSLEDKHCLGSVREGPCEVMRVTRYLANGSRDPSFHRDGTVLVPSMRICQRHSARGCRRSPLPDSQSSRSLLPPAG